MVPKTIILSLLTLLPLNSNLNDKVQRIKAKESKVVSSIESVLSGLSVR